MGSGVFMGFQLLDCALLDRYCPHEVNVKGKILQ